MAKLIDTLFWVFLAAFMLLGAFVVFGQMLGAILHQPSWVEGLDGTPSTAAFVASTLCALAAFAMQYVRRPEATGPKGDGSNGTDANGTGSSAQVSHPID